METFGEMLRHQRKAVRMTQRDLAAAAHIDATYLSKVETGAMEPPAGATIGRLAACMGVDATPLMIAAGKIPADVRRLILAKPVWIEYIRYQSAKVKDAPICYCPRCGQAHAEKLDRQQEE